MTNGEKIIAVLNPRANQIRILGNWVEIEIQKSGINFSCGLDWWNAEYKEPTRKTCNSCGNFGSHNGVCDICNPKYNDLWREKPNCSENPTSSTTKNDLGVDCIVDVLGSYTDLDIPYKREIAENILTKLSSVTPQEPRWIPVSERLPKELCGVLVYCPTNDNIFCAYLEKGVWKIFSPEALEEIKEIVTAWMPLPKAYREVIEE